MNIDTGNEVPFWIDAANGDDLKTSQLANYFVYVCFEQGQEG